MNYNGYPQNMNGMYNNYPYAQMPNQNMMPKYEVIKVKGKPGVDAFHMGPNSSVLLLDETANIVWYVETDGAGYKTATPFDVTPHVEQPPVNMNDILDRLGKLEETVVQLQNGGNVNESNFSSNGDKRQQRNRNNQQQSTK